MGCVEVIGQDPDVDSDGDGVGNACDLAPDGDRPVSSDGELTDPHTWLRSGPITRLPVPRPIVAPHHETCDLGPRAVEFGHWLADHASNRLIGQAHQSPRPLDFAAARGFAVDGSQQFRQALNDRI